MSTTIDQRVVEMKFNNKEFEKNTAQTMSTLDKLKEKLNLTGASKGLEAVDAQAKKMDFLGLSNAVETVNAKFSALQVMGVTALANITNSAVNAGKRIASALTIDPIKTGFSEYETQINAVQTILANTSSKGTTLQQVNAALDQLNTYADKTIYNFTEMTRNIGTFTAAGVDLKTSVSSIQGIANLAAVSGSNSQQASTAMYQLSQALAAGKVQLMDWNSVVNAGMGGQVFQDALKRTAKTMGTDVDKMIKKYGSFRESLTKGEWLTAEVLTKTLEQFTMAAEEGSEEWEAYKKSLKSQGYTEKQAEEILKMANTATDAATKVKTVTQLWDTLKESAQSGWTQTWEIIMGDFGEAKEFLTSVSDTIGGMIGAANDARNNLLAGGLSSGWKQLLGAGISDEAGYQETLIKVAKDSGFAFDKLIKETELKGGSFDDALKTALSDGSISADMMSESVSKLAEKMGKMSSKEREAAGYTNEHIQQIKELDKGLKDGSISMDEFAKKIMRPSGRENLIESLTNTFKGLMNIIKPVKEAFSEIFPPMTSEQLYNITVGIKELTARFAAFTEKHGPKIKSIFKGIFSVVDIVYTVFKELAGGILDITGSLLGFTGGILSGAASLGDWLTKVRDSIKESNIFGKAIDNIVGFVQKAIDKLKEFGSFLGKKIAAPGLQGLLKLLTLVWDTIVKLGSIIGKAFTDALRSGDLNSAVDVFNSGIFATILLGISKFIKNLSGAFDDATGFLGNIKDVLGELKGVLKAYQQDIKANIILKIAKAVGILAASIAVIALIDPERTDHAIGTMALLFTELMTAFAVFTKLSMKTRGLFKASVALIAISSALFTLSLALKIMSTMSLTEMGIGLLTMTVALGELIGVMWALPKGKNLSDTSKAIRKLSGSLLILSVALKIMSTMDWKEMGVALISMTVALGELIGVMWALPKNSSGKAAGMIGLATSLVILGGALKIMASMSWGDIKRGLAVMGGALAELVLAINLLPKTAMFKTAGLVGMATSMVILAGALKIMGKMNSDEIKGSLIVMGVALAELAIALNLMKGTIAGSAALLVAAGALAIITPTIILLGSCWKSAAKGIGVLAGMLATLGIAGLLLKPLIPTLLGLAGTFALVGVGTVAIGIGLGLIAAGITALAVAVATGATAIVAGVSAIIIGIINLIPDIVKAIGTGLILICQVLIEAAPLLAETILVILSEVLASLAKHTPVIVESILVLLIEIINKLSEHIPDLIVAIVNFLGAVLQGVIDALNSVDTTNLLKGIIGLGLLTGLMYLLSGIGALVPGAMVGILGLGVLLAELAVVLAAIGGLAQIPGLSWLIEEGGNLLQKVGTAIGQFIGGIVGGIAEGATSTLPKVGTNLSNFMTNIQPFITGAKAINPSMLDGVKALAETILIITAANVLDGLTSWLTGGNSIDNFGAQLGNLGTNLSTFADNLGTFDPSKVLTIACACDAIKALATAAKTIPNEGGLWAKIAGENSLATFGGYLPGLGTNLREFMNNLGTFDESKVAVVDCAGRAITALAKAASEIPNEGGLWAKIAGENSLVTFGAKLPAFGTNLSQFMINLGTFDDSKVSVVDCAGRAITALAAAAKEIPNEGGLWAKIVGDNSLAKFGDKLPGLGTNLNSFITNLGSFSEGQLTTVDCAGKAILALAKAGAQIPNQGGLAALFAGDNDIGTFAEKLPDVAKSIKGFANNLGTFGDDKVATVNAASKAMEALAKLGKLDLKTASSNLTGFGDKLKTFATKIKGFTDEIALTSADSLSSAISKVQDLVDLANEIGSAKIMPMGTFADKLQVVGTNAVTKFVESLKGKDPIADVTAAVDTLTTTAVDNMDKKTVTDDAATAGKNVVSGFAGGITAQTFEAEAAAKAMAEAALTAAKAALDEHSPSREMYKVGDFAGLGFVNALHDNISTSYNAGYSMADSARKGLTKAVSKVYDLINNDIDTQPVIRPILDLSDIENGTGYLNSMFNDPSVGVMSNINAISSGMNAKLQNGANDSVVRAISKLGKDLGNVGGTTYNINGITYDDGSNISTAVNDLVRAARIERRI